MSDRKKRTVTFAAVIAILVLLGVLLWITKSFAVNAMMHIFVRLLTASLVILVLKKCFREQLADSLNKVLTVCGCVIAADLVIVDAIRYILSGGADTVLILPVCLPICFMIIMAYSVTDTDDDKRSVRRLSYLVGIPLFLLSLYFEVLSFMSIF